MVDVVVDWVKKNADELRNTSKTSSSTSKMIAKYGRNFVKKGKPSILKKYQREFNKVVKEANSSKKKAKFKKDYKANPKTKLNEKAYERVRIQQFINFEKGTRFEIVFNKVVGGLLNTDAIVTSITKRFIDVLKKTVMYELKSGFITVPKKTLDLASHNPSKLKGFAKQVVKDMEILSSKYQGIKYLEYHVVEGITDDAVEFIYQMAIKYKVSKNVKIVLYK